MSIRIKLAWLLVAALALTACGGGGGGGDTLPINLPGGGGGGGTSQAYSPPVTTPPVETFQPAATWKASCFDTLPAGVYQNDSLSAWATEVFTRANSARQQNGVGLLLRSQGLDRVAQAHARDLALRKYLSHYTPDGLAPWERLTLAQLKDFSGLRITSDIAFNGVGENLAKGQETAAEVVNGWMNSPGHRTNLLNSTYMYVGTGIYFDPTNKEMPIHAVQLYVQGL